MDSLRFYLHLILHHAKPISSTILNIFKNNSFLPSDLEPLKQILC